MRLLALFLLLVFACEGDGRSFEQRAEDIQFEQQLGSFEDKCLPLYALAANHTDSMVVHAMRPSDTYHGSWTCFEFLERFAAQRRLNP